MKFIANRSSYMPDGRISLRITVLPELEVRRDTLTAPMEGLQATFLDRIGLNDLKLMDEILKFTVINRGGRKSIQTHKTKSFVRPSAYHGFGIFVLSNLTSLEGVNRTVINNTASSPKSTGLEKIKDTLTPSWRKELTISSGQGANNKSQSAYFIEDDKNIIETETESPTLGLGRYSKIPDDQAEHLSSTNDEKSVPLLQRKFEVDVYSSITDELARVFSNTLLLGLQYEPETEKLSLRIIRASLSPSSLKHNQESYYGKVTLFEGYKVVKAKKTRAISAFLPGTILTGSASKSSTKGRFPLMPIMRNTGEIPHEAPQRINPTPEFDETFCILFPPQYLDHVSCIVSLCGKTNSGSKINFGRAYIGSHEHSTQSGFKQWAEMAANPNSFIIRNHFLDNHPDVIRK